MLGRKRNAGDFNDEITAHIENEVQRMRDQGFSEEDARSAARRKFGNVTGAAERFYEARRWMWWDQFAQDVRFALRTLRKSPGFAAIAALTVALGIGANTALFSIVNGVLLSPLPYPQAGQLVAVYEKTTGYAQGPISYLNFLDWQRETRTFSSIAMYRNQDYNFTGKSESERLSGYQVSAEFFSTLGVAPVAGRAFRGDDDQLGAAPVVMLGGGFWKREFGASADAIGKAIELNGTTYTIVGVVPAGFTFYGQSRDVYTPIGQWSDPLFRDRRIDVSAHAIGRLKPGVTMSQASADMDAVAANLSATYPEADKNVGIAIVAMKEDIVGNVQPFLIVLMAAVGFLLLIACTNVANLSLARGVGRSREFAIRAALGASRGRVISQLLTESLVLAGAGGVFGFALAAGATRAALRILPVAVPRASEAAMDSRVLG
ncbi:MAG TPA: ABC transporter permease, partial [Candidatus Acidoferrales bacterium]|nr:ABC transporter permease [Candidatus Acidoferrales bacterium]